jgi:hypothetical protein
MHAGKIIKKITDTLNLVTKCLVVETIAGSKKDSTPSENGGWTQPKKALAN